MLPALALLALVMLVGFGIRAHLREERRKGQQGRPVDPWTTIPDAPATGSGVRGAAHDEIDRS